MTKVSGNVFAHSKGRIFLGIVTVLVLASSLFLLNLLGGAGSLAQHDSNFEKAEDLANWQQLDIEGWNSKWKNVELNPDDGELTIVPKASAWFEDFLGGFLYQEITGDFIVSTRMRVTGQKSDVPESLFSLAGLLVRKPHEIAPANWQPNQENWLFFSMGSAVFPGQPQFETKSTYNSLSTLKVFEAPQGWVEIRIARVGEVFFLFYKPDGGEWVHLDEFIRPDLPETLQVGLTAYTDWNSVSNFYNEPLKYNAEAIEGGNPDVIATFDFVSFQRPGFSREAIATLSPDRLKALTK